MDAHTEEAVPLDGLVAALKAKMGERQQLQGGAASQGQAATPAGAAAAGGEVEAPPEPAAATEAGV